jgi:hypothetical protein
MLPHFSVASDPWFTGRGSGFCHRGSEHGTEKPSAKNQFLPISEPRSLSAVYLIFDPVYPIPEHVQLTQG